MTPVDRTGRIDVEALRSTVESDPASVAAITTMWANNEMGTIQPVDQVVDIAKEFGIPVHSDAVQAAGYVPLDFASSELDAMTVTAHKVGGPVGVGALIIRREINPVALLHGGGQERDIRSGTVGVALIAAFAKAVDLTVQRQAEASARIESLRARLVDGIVQAVPDAVINGDPQAGPTHRLPNIAHVTFPGCEGDAMLMLFDAQGVECSTGSIGTRVAAQRQVHAGDVVAGLDGAGGRDRGVHTPGHRGEDAHR